MHGVGRHSVSVHVWTCTEYTYCVSIHGLDWPGIERAARFSSKRNDAKKEAKKFCFEAKQRVTVLDTGKGVETCLN